MKLAKVFSRLKGIDYEEVFVIVAKLMTVY